MSAFDEAFAIVIGRADADVKEDYRLRAWEGAGCHRLDAGLALVVFDAAVHSGVNQARHWLKEAVGPNPLAQASAYQAARLRHLAAERRKPYGDQHEETGGAPEG